MPAPRIRLVVLNYNGGDLVDRCVEHLERLDWPADRLEVVVVDNASHRRLRRRLAAPSPACGWSGSPQNLGFPANNLGLRDLDGVDYVGLVNNDAFVEPGYLAPARRGARGRRRRSGAACPKIVFAPRSSTSASARRRPAGARRRRDLGVRVSGVEVDGDATLARRPRSPTGFRPPEHGAADESRVPVDRRRGARCGCPVAERATARLDACGSAARPAREAASTAAARGATSTVGTEPAWVDVPLGRRALRRHQQRRLASSSRAAGAATAASWSADDGQYDEPAGRLRVVRRRRAVPAGATSTTSGLFDERFFMYYEDTDLAWRGRARGWRYRYVPDAVLRHVHAATSVEGSPLFQHFVERNRLVMLTKNARRASRAGRRGGSCFDRLATPGATSCGPLLRRASAAQPRAVAAAVASRRTCGCCPTPLASAAGSAPAPVGARRGDHRAGRSHVRSGRLQPVLAHRWRWREVRRRRSPQVLLGRRTADLLVARPGRRRLAGRAPPDRPSRVGVAAGRRRPARCTGPRADYDLFVNVSFMSADRRRTAEPLRRPLPDPLDGDLSKRRGRRGRRVRGAPGAAGPHRVGRRASTTARRRPRRSRGPTARPRLRFVTDPGRRAGRRRARVRHQRPPELSR